MNAAELRQLPKEEIIKRIDSLTEEERLYLHYHWPFWARPEQLEPEELGKGGKFIWFARSGRGYGKTRIGAQWVVDKVQNHGYKHISIVGSVADEVRQIQIEGESGILACSPPWFMPEYIPSKKQLTWPNGAVARIYYGSEPEKSRGAQSDLVWCDEVVKWKYPEDTFDNILFGLRLGDNPLCYVSSTPKPTKLIKDLNTRSDCIVTTGSTYENKDNLSPVFISAIIKKYEGTRLGRQELEAQILDDNPNALWKREWLDTYRVNKHPKLSQIVVGIDPSASSTGAETGIIVAGEALVGTEFHYYILDDLSLQGRPAEWASQAISAYNKYQANRLVPERNNGGEMVEDTIKNIDKSIPVTTVWASRGKYTRAEPISMLYEKGLVHHVGSFSELEDQLCEWESGEESPDRLDALVWAITDLAKKSQRIEKPKVDASIKSRAMRLPE